MPIRKAGNALACIALVACTTTVLSTTRVPTLRTTAEEPALSGVVVLGTTLLPVARVAVPRSTAEDPVDSGRVRRRIAEDATVS